MAMSRIAEHVSTEFRSIWTIQIRIELIIPRFTWKSWTALTEISIGCGKLVLHFTWHIWPRFARRKCFCWSLGTTWHYPSVPPLHNHYTQPYLSEKRKLKHSLESEVSSSLPRLITKPWSYFRYILLNLFTENWETEAKRITKPTIQNITWCNRCKYQEFWTSANS